MIENSQALDESKIMTHDTFSKYFHPPEAKSFYYHCSNNFVRIKVEKPQQYSLKT